jgi:hypothetical protein
MPQEKMNSSFRTKLLPLVLPVSFFSFLFFFILFYIDPRVIYTFNGIHKYSYLLEFTREYFSNLLSMPGGATKLAVALVIHACYYPWLGAFILTAVAWGFFICSDRYIRNSGGNSLFVTRYLPAFALLPMFTRYNFHYLIFIVPVLGALCLSIVYQRARVSGPLKRLGIVTLLFLISYLMLGVPGSLFLLLSGIHEAWTGKKTLLPLGLICLGAAVFLYLTENFMFPLQTIFKYSDLLDFRKPVVYLYLYVPLLAVIFHGRIPRFSLPAFLSRKPAGPVIIRRVQEFIILLMIAVALQWTISDPANKNFRELGQVLCYTQNELWTKIMEKRTSSLFDGFPQQRTRTLLITTHALYRALYHTGQLGSKMFSFPQVCDPEPLLMPFNVMAIYFPAWALGLNFYIDLGAVNLAEKVAGEAMENMGPHPFLAYQRGCVQIAKGNKELALAYLNKIAHTPEYGTRARRLVHDINDDAILGAYPEIAYLREFKDKDDYVISRTSMAGAETILLNLLKANSRNRMAFEYLMAYYLLTRQPSKISENIYRLDDFGYTEIPALYEEALVLYSHMDTSAAIRTKLPIRQQTYLRLQQFAKEYDLYAQRVPGMDQQLLKDFGTSYFYFHLFGIIPRGKR